MTSSLSGDQYSGLYPYIIFYCHHHIRLLLNHASPWMEHCKPLYTCLPFLSCNALRKDKWHISLINHCDLMWFIVSQIHNPGIAQFDSAITSSGRYCWNNMGQHHKGIRAFNKDHHLTCSTFSALSDILDSLFGETSISSFFLILITSLLTTSFSFSFSLLTDSTRVSFTRRVFCSLTI